MQYGFCHLGIVPVRKTSSDASEMVTQLLFGDVFEIIETLPKWIKIKTGFDAYEGWIDTKQCISISLSEYQSILQWTDTVVECYTEVYCNGNKIPIVRGSSIPNETEFSVGGKRFELQLLNKQSANIEDTALLYMGTPYLWGGRSPFGIDCSGFTQIVFKLNGIKLLRDASMQATQGVVISSLTQAQKNDLLFFSNDKGKITHVGIYLGNNKIIHSSGCVRIDSIDEKGIISTESNEYTHKLSLIKRIC